MNGNTRSLLDSVAQLNPNAVSQLLNMTSNANMNLQQQIAQLLQAKNQQVELPTQIQQSLLINNNVAALQQQRQQMALLQAQQERAQQQALPSITAGRPGATHITTERGPPMGERRIHTGFQRAASDDYVRIIRHQDLSEDNVRKIQIPVPEALQIDPSNIFKIATN
jgi:hypothetical protein